MSTSFLKRVILFASGNIAAQGLAALSGLFLARWMSVPDYGAYTIVTTLMGAITVLTKGGAHLGYSAILGRVWPDMGRAAEAVAAVLRTRRMISLVIMPPILIVTWVLLQRNGVALGDTLLILVLLTGFWWADMRTRLIDQILFFAKQTTRIQILDAILASFRLVAVVALYFAGILTLTTAVAIGVVQAALRVRPILAWVRALLPTGLSPGIRDTDLAEIKTGVRRQMPVELYYVFQAQLVIFVLTIFGSITQIASLGALSRINQLLLPIDAMTYAFLLPVFTRASTERALRIYFPMLFLTIIPGIALVAVSLVFPNLLLWLVGPNYADLKREIFIASLMAVALRGSSTAWNLLAHRGWVRYSWVQIPVGLACCLLSPFVLDLGTVSGALTMQLAFALGWLVAAAMDYGSAVKRQGMK